MRSRRLLWQLYIPSLLIIVISLIAVTVFTQRSVHDFYIHQRAADLEARAQLVRELLVNRIDREGLSTTQATVRELGALTGTRITIVEHGGKVLADSHRDPALMDNHATRPEIMAALAGTTGSSIRFSDTLKQTMMYVAVPIAVDHGDVHAVVRTSLPLTAIHEALRDLSFRIAVAGFLIAGIAAIVSLLLSQHISRPLAELRHMAERFASGDLRARLRMSGSGEVASVAEAMNKMAAQLDDRIRTVVEQRNEQEAVLSSMVEGVLAVDSEQRVITLNNAAARLLDVAPYDALGRSIQEVARIPDLQGFVTEALRSTDPLERDVTVHGPETRYLQAHGAPVRDARGVRIGAVLVLNDVTRLRRLEGIRRDFVANVSHELRTPITSIKGFVETLLNGALDDPSQARHFLEIAARQADRLNAIIEDLLSLSRIEQEADEGAIARTRARLSDVLRAAREACRLKAEEKHVAVQLHCENSIQALVNAPLLEQAVVNLIDNAVKYSNSGTAVDVVAHRNDSVTEISVQDHGAGIEAAHLPRLFERFYRVDKARSRKLGGTGLGLAIVKHIAHAHGGTVRVESQPGKGSTFTISIPDAPPRV